MTSSAARGGTSPTPESRRLLPPDFRRHIPIALLLACLVAVCYLLFDRPVALWAVSLDPGIVAAFEMITVFGSAAAYLTVLAILYPVLRFSLRRAAAAQRALFLIASIAVSGATVDLLKPVAARWRPKAFHADPAQYGFELFKFGREYHSFPSGHATTALAVGCALTLLYPRLRALWLAAAAVVAASRVIVGEHYPGDVIAGAWFGVVVTLLLSRTSWFRGALAAHPSPGV